MTVDVIRRTFEGRPDDITTVHEKTVKLRVTHSYKLNQPLQYFDVRLQERKREIRSTGRQDLIVV